MATTIQCFDAQCPSCCTYQTLIRLRCGHLICGYCSASATNIRPGSVAGGFMRCPQCGSSQPLFGEGGVFYPENPAYIFASTEFSQQQRSSTVVYCRPSVFATISIAILIASLLVYLFPSVFRYAWYDWLEKTRLVSQYKRVCLAPLLTSWLSLLEAFGAVPSACGHLTTCLPALLQVPLGLVNLLLMIWFFCFVTRNLTETIDFALKKWAFVTLAQFLHWVGLCFVLDTVFSSIPSVITIVALFTLAREMF